MPGFGPTLYELDEKQCIEALTFLVENLSILDSLHPEEILDRRSAIKARLERDLSAIVEFYQHDENKEKVKGEFTKLFNSVLRLIYQDFIDTKNKEFIQLFLNCGISPIRKEWIESSEKQVEQEKNDKRSQRRAESHFGIFKQEPFTLERIPNFHFLSERINRIREELSQGYFGILTHQYHWTAESNLQSILRNEVFLGQRALRKKKMFFEPNVSNYHDTQRGDANVICFCPNLVDPLAMYDFDSRQLKKNLVRLTIDLRKAEVQEKYNQFFKIRDLCSPDFDYEVKVNDQLKLHVINRIDGDSSEFSVSINLNGKEKKVFLYGETADHYPIEYYRKKMNAFIFYGNLYAINYYCFSMLFKLLEESNDEAFRDEFLAYLESLDDDEIKKILIIFVQSITVMAEFNFNVSLKHTEQLISAIHYVEENRSIQLDHLSPEAYQKVMTDIMNGKELSKDLPRVEERLVEEREDHLLMNGHHVFKGHSEYKDRTIHLKAADYSTIPAKEFLNTHQVRNDFNDSCLRPKTMLS